MARPVRHVRLREGDREVLESMISSRTSSRRVVKRASIVLAAAGGVSAEVIHRRIGPSKPTVKRWLDRYETEGIKGIVADHPRSGRPRMITAHMEMAVVWRALHERPPGGSRWTQRLMAGVTGLHHTQVGRIWRAHGVAPHASEHFTHSEHGPIRS